MRPTANRTHLALEKDMPDDGPVEREINSIHALGDLHHVCVRCASAKLIGRSERILSEQC